MQQWQQTIRHVRILILSVRTYKSIRGTSKSSLGLFEIQSLAPLDLASPFDRRQRGQGALALRRNAITLQNVGARSGFAELIRNKVKNVFCSVFDIFSRCTAAPSFTRRRSPLSLRARLILHPSDFSRAPAPSPPPAPPLQLRPRPLAPTLTLRLTPTLTLRVALTLMLRLALTLTLTLALTPTLTLPSSRARLQLWGVDVNTMAKKQLLVPPNDGDTEENLSLEEKLRRERQRLHATGVTSFFWSSRGSASIRIMVPLQASNRTIERAKRASKQASPAPEVMSALFPPPPPSTMFVLSICSSGIVGELTAHSGPKAIRPDQPFG